VGIGQWDSTIQADFDLLKRDGAIVLQRELAALLPWTSLPIISTFVGAICGAISAIIIKYLDKLSYAAYVAVVTGKQVNEYIRAIDSGDKDRIGKAADDLVHLGGL
jgi:hypothetical protein